MNVRSVSTCAAERLLRQHLVDQRRARGDQPGQRRCDDQHRVAEPARHGRGDDRAQLRPRVARHVRDARHPQRHAGAGHEVAGEQVGVGQHGRATGRRAAGERQRDHEQHVEGQVDRRSAEHHHAVAHDARHPRRLSEEASGLSGRAVSGEIGTPLARPRPTAATNPDQHPRAGDHRHRQHRPAERLHAVCGHQREEGDQSGQRSGRVRAAAIVVKRSRMASTVAPPAAHSCSTIAQPSTGRAALVTCRPALLRPGAISCESGPASGPVTTRTGSAMQTEHRGKAPCAQARARFDEQRHRGDAQALSEYAKGRVQGERDEEAVRAHVRAEATQIQHGLNPRGRGHREGRQRHRHAGSGLALAAGLRRANRHRRLGAGRQRLSAHASKTHRPARFSHLEQIAAGCHRPCWRGAGSPQAWPRRSVALLCLSSTCGWESFRRSSAARARVCGQPWRASTESTSRQENQATGGVWTRSCSFQAARSPPPRGFLG